MLKGAEFEAESSFLSDADTDFVLAQNYTMHIYFLVKLYDIP